MSGLPPNVWVDLHVPALRDYFRARAAQHTHDSYLGLELCKFPEDLRVYEHLLALAAPDTVIELGTFGGGGALWLHDRLATVWRYGRLARAPLVITVDVDVAAARAAFASLEPAPEIALVEGRLEDPATVAQVERLAGERCMVIEDSAHTFETTTAALQNYARFVSPGSYMIVEDGVVDDDVLRQDEWPRGVRPAIEAFLRSDVGTDFEVRRDLELYGISCHPGGFLRRLPAGRNYA